MRTEFKIFVISIFLMIYFSSCEKEAVNIKYPEFKNKIVVSAYISPDETKQYINISSCIRLYGENTPMEPFGRLKASISDDSHEIVLDSAFAGFAVKSSDFQIMEGKTYILKIENEKGLNISASCTVPYRRKFALEIDTVRIESTPWYSYIYHTDSYLSADLYYTDIEGENNYYVLFCERITYDSKAKESPAVDQISLYGRDHFDDKGIDGKRSKRELGYVSNPKESDSCFLKVYLLNTDKYYYDFKKSLAKYNSGDDPFTEPSPVYTNISGGLGIFASYTIDSLVYRLK